MSKNNAFLVLSAIVLFTLVGNVLVIISVFTHAPLKGETRRRRTVDHGREREEREGGRERRERDGERGRG